MLAAQLAATVHVTPLKIARLNPLTPLPQSTVKEDLYVPIRRKTGLQKMPKVRLVSCHDNQSAHTSGRMNCH